MMIWLISISAPEGPGASDVIGYFGERLAALGVPPEIDARWTPAGNDSTAQVFVSGDRGDPVDAIVRSDDRAACSRGTKPSLRSESRYFADVPKNVSSSRSIRSVNAAGPGWNGEPSYNTAVAPEAGTEARQAAKAAHIDRVMELIRARDEELEVSAALSSLSRRRR